MYAKPSCPADDPWDLLGLLHGSHRVGCRLVMILLSQHGWTAAQIADLLGYDRCTVRRWIHRYHHHGTTALADRPRSRRPRLGQPTATPAHPPAAGPAQSVDDRSALEAAGPARHLAADPAPAGPRARLLAAAPPGRQRRPRPRPAPGPPAPAHPRTPRRCGGAGKDETHINLVAWVRSTWIPRGQRQRIMTPGTNRRRTIFGAIDLATGRFHYQVTRKAISATFTAFCEQLLAAYDTAPLVAVICDNLIIHRSKLVQRW